MSVKEEVKKEFLYYDKRQIDNFKEQYPIKLTFLNEQLIAAENILKRKLKDSEKIKIKNEGVSWIKEEIKKQYPFFNGNDTFNLQALGVNYKALDEVSLKISRIPFNYDYKLLNGVFTELNSEYERYKELAKIYTSNELQNEVLSYCKELEKTFKKMAAANLIPEYAKQHISKVAKCMTAEYENNILTIQPDYEYIKRKYIDNPTRL